MLLSSECVWVITHRAKSSIHTAWYQRALVPGDFAPSLLPRSEYVVSADGKNAFHSSIPTCVTCGSVPTTDDLDAYERSSGAIGVFDDFRVGRRPWPQSTKDHTCWYCNTDRAPVVEHGFCKQCLTYLKGE